MPKGSKIRHQGSKRERKAADYRTPPSVLPQQPPPSQPSQESQISSAVRRSSHHRSRVSPSHAASLTVQSASLPSQVPAPTASPVMPPRPPPLTSASTSMGTTGPSSLPPPSTVVAPASAPSATPQVLTSLSASRMPRTSVYPKPSIPPPSQASSLSRQQVPPTNSYGTERTLQLGASYPSAVTRSASLRELMELRSLRSRTLSSDLANRGQQLLSPLLSRLRSPSSTSPQRIKRPMQEELQVVGADANLAPLSLGSEETNRLPPKQGQSFQSGRREEQRDLQESQLSLAHSRRSMSRTSLSLPQDPSQWPPATATGLAAICLRREEASQLVGKHGPFQTSTFYFALLVAFVLPFHTLPLQIAQHNVDHWCARPNNLRNLSVEQWKHLMLPRSEDGRYSQCRMYAEVNSSRVVTVLCTNWEYAPSAYGPSIVQDFDLVCERAWFLPLSCSASAMGAICMLVVSGPLADRLGRKPVMQFSTVMMLAACSVILFSTILNSFLAMRFLLGAATSTLFNTSFVLLVEVLAPETRTLYSMASMLGKVFGAIIVGALMWAKFSWYTLQLASMLPYVMLLRKCTHLVESPRWLLARGNVEEAETVIMHAATLNGENLFEVRQKLARARRDAERAEPATEGACCDTLRVRGRWRHSVILCYLWTVTAFAAQAASLKIHYLDFYPAALLALSSALSFPTELIAIVSAAHLGRRASQSSALVLAAVCCFVAANLDDDSVGRSAALLLVTSVSVDASQTIGTLYTAEVYPTVARCSGMALCTCFSAAASVATPVAVYLGILPASSVPLGFVSLLCVTAACLVMRLPDTKESSALPDQFSDAHLDTSPQESAPALADTSSNIPSQARRLRDEVRPQEER
ncbi:solute carrier family 22 member 7-like [Dermacentor albipictus]|uniref:solute carrier family 22 member 7-like n=1 Tax=Dermacentor albipictus TaxID=60249 RepID=UPI0031FD8325